MVSIHSGVTGLNALEDVEVKGYGPGKIDRKVNSDNQKTME